MQEYKVVLAFEVYREYYVEAPGPDEAIENAEKLYEKGENPIDWYEEQVDETEVEEI